METIECSGFPTTIGTLCKVITDDEILQLLKHRFSNGTTWPQCTSQIQEF